MPKELGPRVHPAPQHFDSYVTRLDSAALERMEDEVYRLVTLDVDSKAIVEQIEEDGWNREFLTWLVNFTQAQRRPIRAVSISEYERGKRLEDRRFDDGTRLSGLGTLICGAFSLWLLVEEAIILWPIALTSLLIASWAGIRFLVGISAKWNRRNRPPG